MYMQTKQDLISARRETWLTRQTSATTTMHVHGALLTDIARTLCTTMSVSAWDKVDVPITSQPVLWVIKTN